VKELIGKTIVKVEMGEIDAYGSEEVVDQVFKVTCSDGEVLYFSCEAYPDSSHYAKLECMTKHDWDIMVEEGEWYKPLKEMSNG